MWEAGGGGGRGDGSARQDGGGEKSSKGDCSEKLQVRRLLTESFSSERRSCEPL